MLGFTSERRYDPLEGFVIHWDFVLGLPKKYQKCKVTYGIFCKGIKYYNFIIIYLKEFKKKNKESNII